MVSPRSPSGAPLQGGDASAPAEPDPRRRLGDNDSDNDNDSDSDSDSDNDNDSGDGAGYNGHGGGGGGSRGAVFALAQPVVGVLVVALVVLAALAGGLRWMFATEAGGRWLLATIPRVEISGFSGTLLGPSWRVDRLRVAWHGGGALVVDDLRADGLRWRWRPAPHAWIGVDAARLSARTVRYTGDIDPVVLPAELVWPVSVEVAVATVDRLHIDGLDALSALRASALTLDARPGAVHRVAAVAADWHGARISGSASIGNVAPLPMLVRATAAPRGAGDAPAWAAVGSLTGPLAAMNLAATLRGVALSGQAAPALDLAAQLQPQQTWPLARLTLATTALDLAALSPVAPQTRLSGLARIDGSAIDAPLLARVELDNTMPGRWNAGRLPVRRLSLQARGELAAVERFEITRFDIDLADAGGTAGRIGGSAQRHGNRVTVAAVLDAVAPQRLDDRAAALRLSGPVSATLRGWPDPGTTAASAGTAGAVGTDDRWHVDWAVDLDGRLDATPQPVRLAIAGSASDGMLDLRSVRARAGAAAAEGRGLLRRAGSGWSFESSGSMAGFDPLPWWPGNADSAWRRGPHRVSADWELALRLPENASSLAWPALARAIAGHGRLRLHESLLAGVPLEATVALDRTADRGARPSALTAHIDIGGNRIVVDGRGDPLGPGDDDRWQVRFDAPTLAGLAPLARLSPAWAGWVPHRGAVDAALTITGRWPRLHSEGRASANDLAAGPLTIGRGTADWRLSLGAGSEPVDLQLDLGGLQFHRLRAAQLRGSVRGSLAEHRIDLSATGPLLPPAWAMQTLAIAPSAGTSARLRALGSWAGDNAGSARWSARVEQSRLGPWSGSDGAAADDSPGWADADGWQAELRFGPDGSLLAANAEPGRLRLADAVVVRWERVGVDFREPLSRIDLRATLEPFAAAPLLARLQPAMGWHGDLRLAGRVDMRAADRFDADLVIERADGDLLLREADATTALGLDQLKLAFAAHDGRWTLTPAFKGRHLGEVSGQVRLQTNADRRWPQPDAALGGALQARVADLAIWSAWVPPGWRLAGELQGSAALGGSFADPRYTGEIAGSGLALRNLLQGINVGDGRLMVRLDGETARIERFTLRGGDGTLAIVGGADLGRSPQARLQLVADRFRALGRVDRHVVASGRGELALQPGQTRLTGQIVIDEGSIDATRADTPVLDDDVTMRGAVKADDAVAGAAPPLSLRNVAIDVAVDLGRRLRLRGHGLDTLLHGQLRLSSPGTRLAVNGVIRTAGGTYAAYGQKLEIERGVVEYTGAPDNPRLDVLALRPHIDARVGVAITGTPQSPRIRLFADPELSDNEKLSWLVLGRAPDGLGRTDTALLQRAAVALLAGDGEAPTDSLLRRLGIDELSLRQADGDVRETVVALGKQLSRHWYVGYERGVNATSGTWQLIYRIAQRVTVRAQSGLDNSLDMIWTWRVQETPPDAGMRKSVTVPP